MHNKGDNTFTIDHQCIRERESWIRSFLYDSEKLKNVALDGWDEKSINGYKTAITALENSLKKILAPREDF